MSISAPASIIVTGVDSAAAGKLVPLAKKAAEAGATAVTGVNSISYHFPHAVADASDEAVITGACDAFLTELQNALSGTAAQISRGSATPRGVIKQ